MISRFTVSDTAYVYISPHFQVKEFACHDGSDIVLIDVDFVRNQLESIRNYFNKPVTINSGYRTESWNKKVGGATGSYHVKGRAFDIVVKDTAPLAVCQFAQTMSEVNHYGGVLRYDTFTHVDSRDYIVLLDERNGEKKVDSFYDDTFMVRVDGSRHLRIREKPTTSSQVVMYCPSGAYTITQTLNNDGFTWGKLLSGAGWIALNYTERV